MEEIRVYKTKDGEIFKDKSLAENHESTLLKIESIMKLLGGYNREIDPNSCEFANGGGYIVISKDKMTEANIRIVELKKDLGYEEYPITNIRCYEDDYIGIISSTIFCIREGSDGNYLRYGQSYYANNPEKAKNIEFKKDI
jgi:hypothetical protein